MYGVMVAQQILVLSVVVRVRLLRLTKKRIMERKKCYISIPITGRDIDEVKREIDSLKRVLRNNEYIPISPFDREVDFNATHEQHMREDFKLLLDCDAILMARNWERSVGCRAELNVALACGIKIIYTMDTALLW